MFAYGVFKVIYAPHKAFKEIIQNPRYIGPILVMILFIAGNIAFVYAVLSKTYVEQTLPTSEQRDIWTENASFWNSDAGAIVRENSDDYINGTFYGNKTNGEVIYHSIEFRLNDSAQISMQLNGIGSVNCSGSDGYKNVTLRVKRLSPTDAPENVTIYLFAPTPTDSFFYDLTGNFSSSPSNEWVNLTIPLGTDKWLTNANADWGNITGLELDFEWPNPSNITLLVDGLFFGGVFKSPMENASDYLFNLSTTAFMQFTIQWVLLGGLIYIMTKAFRGKAVWKSLLVLTGCSLVTLFIQAIISAATFSTLPTLYYRLELIGGVEVESEGAYNKLLEETWLFSTITGYTQIAVSIWTIALCAVAIRLLNEFSWAKSFLIAAVAYFVSVMAMGLLFSY